MAQLSKVLKVVGWAGSVPPSVPAEAGCLFTVAAGVHVFISGESLHCFLVGWCTNKSYSNLWLVALPSCFQPASPQLPTPLPYKSWCLRAGLEVEESQPIRRQCRGVVGRPFKRIWPPTAWQSNRRGERSSHQSYHASLERRMAATPMNLFRRWSASSGTSGWRKEQQWSGWSRLWRDLPEGRCSPAQQGRQTQRPMFWQSSQPPLATTWPLCSSHFVPRPAAGDGGECSEVRTAPADADPQLNAAQADAVNPAMLCDRFIDGLHPPSLRHDISSLRQGACWRHLPSGTGWGSALDARGYWCGGASRAGPGGSTPAQKGSGGAAGPSSGSDGEDSRAAGWAATPVNPGTTA